MAIERFRFPSERALGWPLALGAGTLGFLIWTLQAGTGALDSHATTPNADASLWEALGYWLHAGW
jgi:hypothetical protein